MNSPEKYTSSLLPYKPRTPEKYTHHSYHINREILLKKNIYPSLLPNKAMNSYIISSFFYC